MANANKKGFFPVRYLNGAPYTGQANLYYIPSGDATAVFVGDLVKIGDSEAGAANADVASGRPIVAQAAAGASTNIHVGVVQGVNQFLGVSNANLNLNRKHRPASVGMYVMVADDPNLVFSGQSDDDTETGNVEIIGSNIDIIVAAGSTVTGFSNMQLDTTTAGTAATLPLKIVGMVQAPDNSINTTDTLIKYEFVINTHWMRAGTIGVAD